MFYFATGALLTLSVLLISVSSHQMEIKIKFLNDVLANENIRSVIVVKASCWPKIEMVILSKFINASVEFSHDAEVINQPLDDSMNKIWFFIDMKCENSVDSLLQTNPRYFGNPYRWILYNITSDQINTLENLPFLLDSNILLTQSNEGLQSFNLQQIYKTHTKASIIYYEHFGVWRFDDGLVDERPNRILSRRRRDLKGRAVSISMVLTNNDSMNHLTDYRDRFVDSPSKASYPLIVHLIAVMNGTANFSFEKTWGYKNPQTGEFDGMTGQLIRNEADIGGTVLFMVPERLPIMDFISMIIDTRVEFVFRAPPLSYVSNIYYYPFVGAVWIATAVLVVLGSIVIYFTYILPTDEERENSTGAFSDIILLASGLVSQMGTHLNPRILSGHISMFTALICLLFVVTSYTANIVALLQSTTKSISTLEDVLNSEMEVGVQDTPYNRHFMPLTTGDVQTRLYTTKIAPSGDQPNFYNLSYGIEKVRQGFFAFYVELGTGYDQIKRTFRENEKCGLIEIPYTSSYMRTPWFAIQKRSPLKEIIKVNIFKIREHGLQIRETSKIYISRPKCDSSGSTFGSVRINDCYLVLLVFLYGSIASIVVIFCELLWKHKIKGVLCMQNQSL